MSRQDADGSIYGGGQKTDTGELAFKLKVPLYVVATDFQSWHQVVFSEGELRQGQPQRALPHAYRALEFIKQVQQASRSRKAARR